MDTLGQESNVFSITEKTKEMKKYWEFFEKATFTVPKTGKYKIEMHGSAAGSAGSRDFGGKNSCSTPMTDGTSEKRVAVFITYLGNN